MTDLIKHYVNDMDETMIQNCIFCGQEISNYQNAMWQGSPPKGFGAGPVYVRKGNPTIYLTESTLRPGQTFKNCTEPKY